MGQSTGSTVKIGPTLAVIAVIAAAFAIAGGKGTGRPAREDVEEHIVIQAEFSPSPREILVMAMVEGVPVVPEGTVVTNSPWQQDFWIPRGATISLNVRQESAGTAMCNIFSNGVAVASNATMDSPSSVRCIWNRK